MGIPKNWHNELIAKDTPVDAAGLIDLEERMFDEAAAVAAGGIMLGYAEITASATQATGNANVTGLSITVVVAARPIVVEFECAVISNDTSGGSTILNLKEGSTVLDTQNHLGTTALNGMRGRMRRRLTPSAGSHTYVVNMTQSVASRTSTMSAAATFPAWISATEV